MREKIKSVVQIIFLGAFVVVGMRAAEWVIPQPEMRVVVCLASEIGKIDSCHVLKDLLNKQRGEQ